MLKLNTSYGELTIRPRSSRSMGDLAYVVDKQGGTLWLSWNGEDDSLMRSLVTFHNDHAVTAARNVPVPTLSFPVVRPYGATSHRPFVVMPAAPNLVQVYEKTADEESPPE